MKTTLNADGQIPIPKEIRENDHLAPGDSFEFERLTPGYYTLAKRPKAGVEISIGVGDDGLPLIRVPNGVITSHLVKEIESQTP